MSTVPRPLPPGLLAERLAPPAPLLACFDYDGTLAPIRPTPEEAEVPEAVRAGLAALAACAETGVAVVSGRPIAELRGFLGAAAEGLWLVGQHGLAIAAPGERERHSVDVSGCSHALEPLRRRGRELVAATPGLRLEDKGAMLALHTRGATDRAAAERAAAAFRRAAGDLAGDFEAIAGKEVVEVRPRGIDKGTTVAALVDRFHRESGRGPVLYVGDDTTDEDAFRRLDGDRQALTLRVGGDDEPSAASYRVESPAAVAELLTRLVELRGGSVA